MQHQVAPAIEDAPLNRFHKLLTIRSGGGSFVDGYVLSIVGVAMVQMTSALHLTEFWEGMIAASALAGIFLGGAVGGWLTDKLGRRTLFFLGPTLFTVFSLAQFWVDSPFALFLIRFVLGMGIGAEYPIATALLTEFLPRRNRGPRLAALTLLWFGGAAFAYLAGSAILAVMGGPNAWRIVLASSTILGVLLFAIRLGTPESPRWLLNKGRRDEADGVIRAVFGHHFSCDSLPTQSNFDPVSVSQLVRSGYVKRLIFVSIFWTCSIIPVFAIYAFAPKVLQALHLKGEMAALGSVAITALFVVGCALAVMTINAIGRRSMLIHSFLWSGVALFLLAMFPDASPGLVLMLFGLYAVFIGGAQVLSLVYPNEIFPTEIRALAVGIGTSLSRVGAAVGTYLVPMALQSMGVGMTMYVAAAVTSAGLLVSYAMAPETRFLDLDQAASLGH